MPSEISVPLEKLIMLCSACTTKFFFLVYPDFPSWSIWAFVPTLAIKDMIHFLSFKYHCTVVSCLSGFWMEFSANLSHGNDPK